MIDIVTTLNSSEIETLKKEFDLLVFPNDFDLVYENQVPNAGIALIEGEILVIKDSKIEKTITSGHMLGVKQLLSGSPVKCGLRVRRKSKIILLGKSDILSYVQDKKSKLFTLMKSIRTCS